jgi:uncharacterized repeat protein (TIGR03803 family)
MGIRNWTKKGLLLFLLYLGTATKLPAQTLTTLYTFCSQTNCTDGAFPAGQLVLGKDGNLYGITQSGGSGYNKFAFNFGGGTVFKLSSSALSTLYDFCDTNTCDMVPNGTLVQGSDGNFYGTTPFGGTNKFGTVFKITPNGTLTTLYSFCPQPLFGCQDGSSPLGGVVEGSDGNFYGTTSARGTGAGGGGTIFKMAPNGNLTTLYSFCGIVTCPDGSSPAGSLIQGTDGDFYGMTAFGGANGNGALFKVASDGSFTSLYSFCSQPLCTDGSLPFDGSRGDWALLQGPDGNFYGTTAFGGANNSGTVFKVTTSGTLTTLYSFCPPVGPPNFCPDGSVPLGGVVRGVDGNLYGTTNAGGTTNSGTLFQLALACVPAADVTNSVAITRSGFSYSTIAKLYGQTLTVKNMTGSPISGPIYVVLDGLSADATLDEVQGYHHARACG